MEVAPPLCALEFPFAHGQVFVGAVPGAQPTQHPKSSSALLPTVKTFPLPLKVLCSLL